MVDQQPSSAPHRSDQNVSPSTQSSVRKSRHSDVDEHTPIRSLKSIVGQEDKNDRLHPDPSTLTDAIARRASLVEDEDHQPIASAPFTAAATPPRDQEPATWMSLPQKGQLAVLTLARLSEPLAERSLSAYMFYQLRSFDPSLPDSTISSQGGMLTAAFAGAQFLTAVWWGRAADSPRVGRKRVILVGLFGTALASVGVGFSRSFAQALGFRVMAGALNGNVGVMRTMVSEMVKERKYQSRAFLLLPMCFNVGIVVGPMIGGVLADPINSFPGVFGAGSVFGGKDGVYWMRVFPYAFPNMFSCLFISMAALLVIFGLDETHRALKHKQDWGRRTSKYLLQVLRRRWNPAYKYQRLDTDDTELQATPHSPSQRHSEDTEQTPPRRRPLDTHRATPLSHIPSNTSAKSSTSPTHHAKSPFRRLLTTNIILTLIVHYLLALHVSTFNALIFLFLPLPRRPSPPSQHNPLRFSSGLGLTPSRVGLATSIIGTIGLPLQLLLYPRLTSRLGTLRSYRTFLPLSLLAYTLLPFLTYIPTSNPAQTLLLWLSLTLVLTLQVLSRTFALPSATMLINNASPDAEALGTLHGLAQSVSSAARMVGPTVGGWGLGAGVTRDCVGGVWWAMGGVVVVNWGLSWGVWEGDGSGGRA